MVYEADITKVIERVRRSMESSSGDSPYTFKRKKAVYRALDKNDCTIIDLVNHELAVGKLLKGMVLDMFTTHAYFSPNYLMRMKGLSEIV